MTDEDRGGWFISHTGRRIYPLDIREQDIHIQDIAHALSLTCRWAGHCTPFYSVAEHSIMCAEMAALVPDFPNASMRWCLLHDAAEAYVHDAITPFKPHLRVELSDGTLVTFKDLEDRILKIIVTKYGLPWPMPAEVHEMDIRMLRTEAEQITPFKRDPMYYEGKGWLMAEPLEGLDLVLRPWHETEQGFLHTFKTMFPEFASEAEEPLPKPPGIASTSPRP